MASVCHVLLRHKPLKDPHAPQSLVGQRRQQAASALRSPAMAFSKSSRESKEE